MADVEVECISGHLLHPERIGVSRHTRQIYAAALELNKEEDIVGDETAPSQHFHGEEVHPGEHRHVRSNEVFPSRGLTPFRCGRDSMPSENVSNRLIGNAMTEVGQCSGDPVITPARILFGHLYDQTDNLSGNRWPTKTLAMLGTIELPGDEPAVPGENSFRPGDHGDFGQRFAAPTLADFGQRGPLRIAKVQTIRQVCSQDSVLGDQVLVSGVAVSGSPALSRRPEDAPISHRA
jgi:hypothetical protein